MCQMVNILSKAELDYFVLKIWKTKAENAGNISSNQAASAIRQTINVLGLWPLIKTRTEYVCWEIPSDDSSLEI